MFWILIINKRTIEYDEYSVSYVVSWFNYWIGSVNKEMGTYPLFHELSIHFSDVLFNPQHHHPQLYDVT